MMSAYRQMPLPRTARRGKQRRPVEDRLALRFPKFATAVNAWLNRAALRLPGRWRVRQWLIEYAAWRAYNATGRGDLDVLRTFNHADTIWDWSRFIVGEQDRYHGRDGVVRANQEWADEWSEWNLDVAAIEEVKPNVLFVHLHMSGVGRTSGAPVEMDLFHVLRLRSGLVWRGTFLTDRAEAREAANAPD